MSSQLGYVVGRCQLVLQRIPCRRTEGTLKHLESQHLVQRSFFCEEQVRHLAEVQVVTPFPTGRIHMHQRCPVRTFSR